MHIALQLRERILIETDWQSIRFNFQTLVSSAPDWIIISFFATAKRAVIQNVAANKMGLFCSSACTSCQGQWVSNVESPAE